MLRGFFLSTPTEDHIGIYIKYIIWFNRAKRKHTGNLTLTYLKTNLTKTQISLILEHIYYENLLFGYAAVFGIFSHPLCRCLPPKPKELLCLLSK